MRHLLITTSLVLAALLGVATNVYASHALGADITYGCDDDPNTPGIEYNVSVVFYRDCDGISAPTSVTVDINPSGACGQPTPASVVLNQVASPSGLCPGVITSIPDPANPGMTIPLGSGSEVSPTCSGGSTAGTTTCNGGTLPGVEAYYYCGTITLPPGCEWVVSYDVCCRNDLISTFPNASSNNQYVDMTINTTTNQCNTPLGN